MSKPAARVGDMHVCPMVTPGTPPVPHVGGPIIGPGVPTVLIGGMPAAVMGDMCVCTGPPDTIILGSAGVFIGGKPAARMGDSNAHGGTIVVGCPTVLIGESSGGGGGGGATAKVQVLIDAIDKVKGVEKSVLTKIKVVASQIAAVTQASDEGLPFCELCEAPESDPDDEPAADENGAGSEVAPQENDEIVKKIAKIYFTDEHGNNISKVEDEKKVILVIESENISGEEVIVNLYDHPGDFTYQGKEIENNQLTIAVSGDKHKIELGVKLNN